MRATLALETEVKALDIDYYERILQQGETGRFCRYVIEKISLPVAKMAPDELREIVVKEMKALRHKVGKELKTVPPGLMDKCARILWDN